MSAASPAAPFGRVLTAMVTPFTPDGELDVDAAQRIAAHLVESGNDGLVLSGTTGESPTTSDDEKSRLAAAVLEAVGDRAHVLTGVGTADTAHSVHLAERAAKAGAHGTLLVTPYYSKPPQAGIVEHVRAVAEAGGLPVMLYDIPGRSAVGLSADTLTTLARHELVVAVKDATGDLSRGTDLMAGTDLAFYSGDDALNLAWLTHGAAGIVSVVAHAAAPTYAAMVHAVLDSDLPAALRCHQQAAPAVRGLMGHTQGAIGAKVALQLLGVLDSARVRGPLPQPDAELVDQVRGDLVAAGILT
jgi:4-hydroxy-tetrahydrodipicolinate synthase